MRFTQFGYNATIAAYMVPLVGTALVGNGSTQGGESRAFAAAALVTLGLAAYSGFAAYSSFGVTASKKTAQARVSDSSDALVVDFEQLSAWKWLHCLIVGVIAAISAVVHFSWNTEATGPLATLWLIYMVVDIGIAAISLNQFWQIKSGQVVELVHKASDQIVQR